MIKRVVCLRPVLLLLLLTLPLAFPQTERVVSAADGNFELRGTLTAGGPVTLRFRSKAGLGYRVQFTRAAFGRLDDPGRRAGILAAPAATPRNGGAKFQLTANGPRLQLELDGKPAWEYVEKEGGIASSGAVRIAGTVREIEFRALPATPPSFAERYGPGLGENIPAIRAVDQSGKMRDFASLRGPKGLWILFVRSADW